MTSSSSSATAAAGAAAALDAGAGAGESVVTAVGAEMLKSAGFGKSRDAFGGGAGEEQFGSFLRQAQATEMVKQGGIGLAEHLFEALKERSDEIS